ncbi:MAG: hypothetical protein IJU44_08875 [Kiritimatiellae bacterium]|nr:hypothetical protein [Kiritimatiellia bacterium]
MSEIKSFGIRAGIAFSAFICAVGMAAAANIGSLTISLDGDNVAVKALDGVLNDTSKLYLVWDDIDHGNDFASWPESNRIQYTGAVASSEATYTIKKTDVPNGSVMRVFATSDARLIDGWVRMAANQYINTGILATDAYGIELRFRPIGSQSANWSSVVSGMIDNFTIGVRNTNFSLYYLRYRTVDVGSFALPDIANPHTLSIIDQVASVDGNAQISGLDAGSIGTNPSSIFFGCSNNGSGSPHQNRYCHAEWYFLRLFDADGNMTAEFVPALWGDTSAPEAIFFETVSKQCFRSAGTDKELAYNTAASVTGSVPVVSACSVALATGLTAWWTGKGDLANINDPANWACTNGVGEEVVGQVPDVDTIVMIEGPVNFNIPFGQTLTFRELHLGNCTLLQDSDWRGLGVAQAPVLGLAYLDVPKGAYINTGFQPNEKTRIVLDVTVQGSAEYWCGCWDRDYKTGAFAVCNDVWNVYSGFGNDGGGMGSAVSNGRHVIDYDRGELKVDGELHHTRDLNQVFQVESTLYLFAQNRNGSMYQHEGQKTIRFHSCKIYDDDVLVRDYVPVDSGGTSCLYERRSGTYVMNAGSGSFEGGAQTGDAIGVQQVIAPINGPVDLAGHKLTIGNISGMGTIWDSVGGGEIHAYAGEGETTVNLGVRFAGAIPLIKEGAGTFVGGAAGQSYTGGTLVAEGWIKNGVVDGAWGPAHALITVADGAGFDWAGKVEDSTTTPYNFAIEGSGPDGKGAMFSSVNVPGGNSWNRNCIADMELTGDTLIDTPNGNMAIIGFDYKNGGETLHTLTMNGHTLTIVAGDRFCFRCVKTEGTGTIVCMPKTESEGMRQLSFYGGACDLSSVTLDIHDESGINVETPFSVGTYIDRRTAVRRSGNEHDQPITVLDRFMPVSTNLLKTIILGDETHLAPVLDLSAIDEPFILPEETYTLSAAEGALVTLNLAGREGLIELAQSNNPYILTWSAAPQGFNVELDQQTQDRHFLLKSDDTGLRLIYVGGTVILLR